MTESTAGTRKTADLQMQRLIDGHASGWHENRRVGRCPECRDVPREVIHEPFRPSQNQTALTEAFAGIKLDIETCSICYANRGVSDHHLVFRSAGGEEGPTLPVCLRCHNCFHDRHWFPELTPEGLFVNNAEGELIWRLLRWPIAADAGEFVQMLDNVSDATRSMPELAAAMLPWEMSEVFASLRSLGDSAWKSQSRMAGEVWRYRLPHLKPSDRIDAIADRFSLRKSQCYNLVSLDNCFPAEKSNVLDETPLSMGTVLEAARSTEPEKWLKHAEQRKMDHPQYSRQDLREDIIRAGERKQPPAETEPAGPKMVWGKCQGCGAVNWFERLPVGAGLEE